MEFDLHHRHYELRSPRASEFRCSLTLCLSLLDKCHSIHKQPSALPPPSVHFYPNKLLDAFYGQTATLIEEIITQTSCRNRFIVAAHTMAGNFWQSSHHQQWILDKQDLVRERQHDLQVLTEEEYQKLFIFFANVTQVLGEQLKLRQQVIATATVYFKRFYARNSLKSIDPLLLAPTCIFLASKVEEFGVISNSRLISTCQTVIKNKFGYAYQQEFPYRINHILECEFYLLENLDCCLIVYQPYRPLLPMIQDIGQEDQLLPMTWRIINDSLRTDVSLLYPPYQVFIFFYLFKVANKLVIKHN